MELSSVLKDARGAVLVTAGAVGTGVITPLVNRFNIPLVLRESLPVALVIGAGSLVVKKADLPFIVYGALAQLATSLILQALQTPVYLPSARAPGSVLPVF